NLQSRFLKVERQNARDPLGPADSGLLAPHLDIDVSDQMLVMGWVKANNLVDINISASTGQNGFVTYGDEINSLTADKGSTIQSLSNNSEVRITTSHSIYSATGIFAQGTDSKITVDAGTGLTLLEGGTMAARQDRGLIEVDASGFIHILSGSAVVSGARFDDDNNAILTGRDARLIMRTAGEMKLAGSVTAAGAMTLEASEVQDDFAEYFNTLNGRTLTKVTAAADIERFIGQLNAGNINPAGATSPTLRTIITNTAKLPLGNSVSVVSMSNYTPFADLPETVRDQIAADRGYTVYKDGGFFNAVTGVFKTSIADGPMVGFDPAAVNWGTVTAPASNTAFSAMTAEQKAKVAAHLGYTAYQGTVYYDADAPADRQIRTTFAQGVSADYNNADINWAAAGVPAPAANAAFTDLTIAQRIVVANHLNYYYDYLGIAADYWMSVPFDYNTVPRQEWIDVASINFAQVIEDQHWNSVIAPAAGTAYGSLSAAQKSVVDRYVKFNQAIAVADWGDTLKPAANTAYSGLTTAQKAVVDKYVKFDEVLSAADWGNSIIPAANATYGTLTAAQKAVVDRYVRFTQVVPEVPAVNRLSQSASSANTVAGQGVGNAFDANPATRYANTDKAGSGLTVAYSAPTTINALRLTSASDGSAGDPTRLAIYGADSDLAWSSGDWTLIANNVDTKLGTPQITSARVGVIQGIASDDVLINGKAAFTSAATLTATTNVAAALASAINSNTAQHQVVATASNSLSSDKPTATSFAVGDLVINGTSVAAASSVSALVANISRDVSGITASLASDGTITLSNTTGNDIIITGTAAAKAGFTGSTAAPVTYKGFVNLAGVNGGDIVIQARSVANGFTGGAGTLSDVTAFGLTESAIGGQTRTID
ncbi:MAG: hypothetical protein RI906_1112, partial [Pseudomonadota bacterium]